MPIRYSPDANTARLIAPQIWSGNSWIVRKDAPYKSFGELKGKKIGNFARVTGAYFFSAVIAKENKLEKECFGTACPLELESTRDSAKTLAVFADIFLITGLITAGVGVTLFVLDLQDDTPSASVEAGCFGGGCGLIANGHF